MTFYFLGHVTLQVSEYRDGERTDKFVKPSSQAYYLRDSGKCVTFSLSDFLSIRQLVIMSPVPVTVYLHGKNQFYSSELRSSMIFKEENSYIVNPIPRGL